MIRTAITLLVVAALLNALGRIGVAAWQYFQLKDHAQQLVLFGAAVPVRELERQFLLKAAELDAPVDPQDVSAAHAGNRTTLEAYYVRPIELFPNFVYEADLSFSVEALAVGPSAVDTSGR